MPGEPEAYMELDDDLWTKAIAAFKKRTGRWPEGNEGFEIAEALRERTQ